MLVSEKSDVSPEESTDTSSPKRDEQTAEVSIPENAVVFSVLESSGTLSVRCDGDRKRTKKVNKDEIRIFFEQTTFDKCKVRYISSEGKVMKSTVKDVTSGIFVCFVENGKDCERE